MGNFQRFELGATWLLALVGIGATYMITGFRFLGLGCATLGLLIFLHSFRGDLKRLITLLISRDVQKEAANFTMEFWVALVVVPVVFCVTGYVFFFSVSSSEYVLKTPVTITQDHPIKSPPVVGDHNQITINPEVNPNAPIVTYDFNGERRTTRNAPSLQINIEEETPQKQAFQTMVKLHNDNAWSSLKEMSEQEMEKTPEWLTPSIFAAEACANLGEIDKAIKYLEHVREKASGREDYAEADRLLGTIRQKYGK